MTDDLPLAVRMAALEKAHRLAVEDVMQSDMGDVERVSRILAMEAEHLGHMEALRMVLEIGALPKQGRSNG